MIDWALTKEKFGISSTDGYRPKVVVRCDTCGSTTRDLVLAILFWME